MGAAKLLKEKRPLIFWTCCATHSINLMLESIAGLPRFKRVLEQAKSLTIFIYAHYKTLAMMRSFTKKRDIVRPGVTKFASAFLTLQNLADTKVELKTMFISNEWDECKFANTVKGKHAYYTVVSQAFWQGVALCLKVFAPLVNVLRIVDQDKKPSMGFVYGELIQAKEDIKKALNGVEKNYEPIIRIIEEKMKNRLDTPLHLMAFLLNPYYHYKDPLLHLDVDVSIGSIEFIETYYFGDIEMQNKVLMEELSKYKKKDDMFGKSIAVQGCEFNDEQYDPAMWWSTFGVGTPNLKRLAMKILSLTSSSSGCERNWSIFEKVHTKKKRNKVESNRLNNLVIVQFNANLMNKRKKEKNVELLLANDASFAQDWIVDNVEVEVEDGVEFDEELDEALRLRRSCRLRELEEDNFESETEEEVDVVEFEDDENHVID
ncbi:PREDICTED: uncharacterized protein LOC109173320 [Ipomoea nil]|uniref:uncharacterized protein LOC109173320 n=1 Tax=Ipomoea nil TaxID=35883 RepID=UPI00090108FB|nr:PREDICTED: uncharacterized protein LOC109173320 [Ipomoea nil]